MLGELSYSVSGLADFDTAEASAKAIEIRLELQASNSDNKIDTLIDGFLIILRTYPWKKIPEKVTRNVNI